MSVVSTTSNSRPSRATETLRSGDESRISGAAPWLYLLLLWAAATGLLALGAAAVVAIAS